MMTINNGLYRGVDDLQHRGSLFLLQTWTL